MMRSIPRCRSARLAWHRPPRPERGRHSAISKIRTLRIRSSRPVDSPEVLSKFPPTLIITGTRGFELSSALYTHEQLVKQGVEAELHVWEGLFHGFFYNADVPESKDAFNVMIKFFDRHLGAPVDSHRASVAAADGTR